MFGATGITRSFNNNGQLSQPKKCDTNDAVAEAISHLQASKSITFHFSDSSSGCNFTTLDNATYFISENRDEFFNLFSTTATQAGLTLKYTSNCPEAYQFTNGGNAGEPIAPPQEIKSRTYTIQRSTI